MFEPRALAVAGRAPTTRVLVVEDDPFVRTGLVDLLSGRGDLVCCDQVGGIAETMRSVAQHRPELILMDLKLEDGDALSLISSLSLQFPAMAILVLSQQDEALYAQRALEAGARGYLMKEAAGEYLHGAISLVLAGHIYLSPAMTSRLYPPGAPCESPGLPRVL